MTKPIETGKIACIPQQNGLVKRDPKASEVREILGIVLPNPASVCTTEKGGIVATQTNILGTETITEIEPNGDYYFSKSCGDTERLFIENPIFNPDGSVWADGNCRDFHRVKQSGSVSPEKLKTARALIAKLSTDPVKKKNSK